MMRQQIKLATYALCLFVCYFYYGIFHEKITRKHYGQDKEKFIYSVSLVLCQCIVNATVAYFAQRTFLKHTKDDTKNYWYASAALTYLLAMLCSNLSLQHINYPTQVVGKSCKPVPVLILSVLIGKRSYPLTRYLVVSLIVIGMILFNYKSKETKIQENNHFYGQILIVLSLIMDGLTGAAQERMRSQFKTKSYQMMLNMNLWSVIYLSLISLMTAEWISFIYFIQRYPFLIYNIFCFSILSSIGQLFIFLTVAEFGALPLSIITTVRKFFTVLASVVFFDNTFTTRQWIGTIIIFIALGFDAIFTKNA